MKRIVIIGAGMGGLTAAIRLAQRGCDVTVLDGRDRAGGLAAGLDLDGFRFDAGPYILLDRAGLEWSFEQLGLDISALALQRIEHPYEVNFDGQTVRISASLDDTAKEFDQRWPRSGADYRAFIRQMQQRYARLQPLQWASHPTLRGLITTGSWRDLRFLFRSLGSVLGDFRLPEPLCQALGIWTHVAGQTLAKAPSPLAFVPGVIHGVGAYYPRGGIAAVPETLFHAAEQAGIDFRLGVMARQIRCVNREAVGVELNDGEFLPADAVISNVGLGTYLQSLDDEGLAAIPARVRQNLSNLPLQSPGVCAYLAVRGRVKPPYLRFQLQSEPDGCRLLVTPGVLDPTSDSEGWFPARLVAPLNHQRAEAGGESGQREFLARVLEEPWWRNHVSEFRVLATRIPQEWGRQYFLYRNSMNPVMTGEFMRAGRLAHRSPWIRRLYLTGSATHPGQWVSFCAVSGVLTADQVLNDHDR